MQLLQRGDKIQIVAPARKISLEELQPAITYFQNQGWEVLCSNLLWGQYHQFSGTDEERTRDFQQALDNVVGLAIQASWNRSRQSQHQQGV